MDLVILQRYVVFVHLVALLQYQFVVGGSDLKGDDLLQVSNSIGSQTFDLDLLTKTIVSKHLYHGYVCEWKIKQ